MRKVSVHKQLAVAISLMAWDLSLLISFTENTFPSLMGINVLLIGITFDGTDIHSNFLSWILSPIGSFRDFSRKRNIERWKREMKRTQRADRPYALDTL